MSCSFRDRRRESSASAPKRVEPCRRRSTCPGRSCRFSGKPYVRGMPRATFTHRSEPGHPKSSGSHAGERIAHRNVELLDDPFGGRGEGDERAARSRRSRAAPWRPPSRGRPSIRRGSSGEVLQVALLALAACPVAMTSLATRRAARSTSKAVARLSGADGLVVERLRLEAVLLETQRVQPSSIEAAQGLYSADARGGSEPRARGHAEDRPSRTRRARACRRRPSRRGRRRGRRFPPASRVAVRPTDACAIGRAFRPQRPR